MDPDESLSEIRGLLTPPRGLTWNETARLAELVDGLDDWLSHGGVLPKEWRHSE